MNCKEFKDLLIEFSEGLLDTHAKESIEQHLNECPECRKKAENIFALQDRILKNSRCSRSIDLVDRVMDRIAREKNARLKAAGFAYYLYQIRRFFMKNTLLKIAITAVVVFAVFIGMNFSRSDVSFAQVVEPILHARTLEYDVFVPRFRGFCYHDIVVEGKIRRSLHSPPLDTIIDVDNSSILSLDSVHKTAVFQEAETKGMQMMFEMNRDFLRLVRDAVGEALHDAPSAVEEMGQKKMDGHIVFGYKLQPGTDGEEVVIWADRDTGLPVEIDINLGKSYPKSQPIESEPIESSPSTPGEAKLKLVKSAVKIPKNYILKNIRFDVPVDESLLEMPSDYKLIDMKQFNNLMMENSFVTMMRLWSEKLSDGFFLKNMPPADFLKQFLAGFHNIMKCTPEEREKLIADEAEVLRSVGLEDEGKQFLINLSPEEWEDFLITVSDGFRLINNLEKIGTEWRYSGSGVQLGEGDREILRYRMPDASSWRVIYGDLHAEDIPLEDAVR